MDAKDRLWLSYGLAFALAALARIGGEGWANWGWGVAAVSLLLWTCNIGKVEPIEYEEEENEEEHQDEIRAEVDKEK